MSGKRIAERIRAVDWKPRAVVAVFFALYLSVGLAIFKDYGVGWDENNNRYYGIITIKHVLGMRSRSRQRKIELR